MSSLFERDPPPGPDPAVAKQQADERARAEASNLRATQDQLTQETLLRGRGRSTGIRSLLGSFGSGGSLLGSS